MALADLIAFDSSHADVVCGCDEAGRGCFAGPLVAAAVRLDYLSLAPSAILSLARLDDSKKLTTKVREELYAVLLASADAISVSVRCARSIDERGLHVCNLNANHTALTAVARPGCALLADGFQLPAVDGRAPVKLIRGDNRSAAVAAASVVAKVTRDRLMTRLAVTYPGYGFERHAGYGTAAHQQAMATLGLTVQHRRSFKGVVELGERASQQTSA